jgi:hypothetical protein
MSELGRMVEQAFYDFCSNTGVEPKVLYLGRNQSKQLDTLGKDLAVYLDPSYQYRRRRFMQLEVYVVDDTDFLAVGIKPENAA